MARATWLVGAATIAVLGVCLFVFHVLVVVLGDVVPDFVLAFIVGAVGLFGGNAIEDRIRDWATPGKGQPEADFR